MKPKPETRSAPSSLVNQSRKAQKIALTKPEVPQFFRNLYKGVAPLSESWMTEEAGLKSIGFSKNVGKALLSKKEKD